MHSYANVYFHARNPMMRRLLGDGRDDLIVVRVSQAVLDIPGTVLTDGNAASGATRFYPSPAGLANLDSELIFARYWTDANFSADWDKKRARNAEVLVPDVIPSMYIEGCYVDTPRKRGSCREFGRLPAVTIYREIYFR